MQALRWLRGWASEKEVAEEFHALQQYTEQKKKCDWCLKTQQLCAHTKQTLCEKFKDFIKKSIIKPVIITASLIVISIFTPLFINAVHWERIMSAYNVPIEAKRAMTLSGYAKLLGILSFLCVDRFVAKRKLYLIMSSIIFLSTFVLSCYGFASTNVTELQSIPFACIILVMFCLSGAGNPILNMSIAFPYRCALSKNFISALFRQTRSSSHVTFLLSLFRIRRMAIVMIVLLYNVLDFSANHFYIKLESVLSIPGVALFSCVVAGIGFIVMYNILPELGNRTMEEIEIHFADDTKKITDYKIAKIFKKQNEVI